MLYASRYAGGGDLLELAAAADCPPVLLLRRLLEAAPLGVPRAVRLARAPGARPTCWHTGAEADQPPNICKQSERRNLLLGESCLGPRLPRARRAPPSAERAPAPQRRR